MFKIATLGFGEAARAFVSGWRSEMDAERLGSISTFDIKIEDTAQHNVLIDACVDLGVVCAPTRAAAFKGRSAVLSLVTADRALEAAQAALPFLEADSLYLDCNSCSPATKAAAAALIEAAGIRYVDVASWRRSIPADIARRSCSPAKVLRARSPSLAISACMPALPA